MAVRRWHVGIVQKDWDAGENDVPLRGEGPPDLFGALVDATAYDKLLTLAKALRAGVWEQDAVGAGLDLIDKTLDELGEANPRQRKVDEGTDGLADILAGKARRAKHGWHTSEGYICDGCSVLGVHEHRCHGSDGGPECMCRVCGGRR